MDDVTPAAESPDLLVYGKPDCVDFLRSKALLDALSVPFEYHDIVARPVEAAAARLIGGGPASPVLLFADGTVLVEPSDEQLAAQLGRPVPEFVGDPADNVCLTAALPDEVG